MTARRLRLDQRDPSSIDAAIAEAGQVDLLVNNVGVEEVRPSLEVDKTLWGTILDTNLKGAFFVARGVEKSRAEDQGGVGYSRQRHRAGIFPDRDDGYVL